MKTTSPPGEGPGRLTRRSARWLRKSAPMMYHIAKARGVDPSQITRELSGERRSALAAAEEQLVRMARYSRTNPEVWLVHIHARISRARIEAGEVGSLDRYLELCEQETQARFEADVAELRFRNLQTGEALDELEEAQSLHVARGMETLHYLPLLRRID